MITVNSTRERDSHKNAIRFQPVSGGRWNVYFPGDALPPNAEPTPAERAAEAAAQAKDEADTAAAKGDAKLAALRDMTPDEVKAWASANVTTLPQTKDLVITLAVAVSILARRL